MMEWAKLKALSSLPPSRNVHVKMKNMENIEKSLENMKNGQKERKNRREGRPIAQLGDQIMEWYTSGLTFQGIVEKLAAEHGIKTSVASVYRIVQDHRSQRAEVVKEVVRDKLAGSMCRDVDRLELLIRRAMKLSHGSESDPQIWLKYVEQIRKLIETKLWAAGMGTPDTSASTEAASQARDRVLEKLSSLVQRNSPHIAHG